MLFELILNGIDWVQLFNVSSLEKEWNSYQGLQTNDVKARACPTVQLKISLEKFPSLMDIKSCSC